MIEELNKKYNIILASGSPRRQELLQRAGYQFEVITANVDESFSPGTLANDLVITLSQKKANAVADKIEDEKALIIAADTIVAIENEILGKPYNFEEAKHLLFYLSNKKNHRVITGVCIKLDYEIITFSATTEVVLNKISLPEIEYYCNNYEVLDKAGAYGIQDWIGLNKIKALTGCYYNVMGLPVSLLYQKLEELINTKNSTLT